MKLILPKTYIEDEAINAPLFFLAGPIKGGGNWQETCCLELQKRIQGEFFAVVPCRWTKESALFTFRIEGRQDYFPRQTPWEYHYLALAAQRSKKRKGCPIFFLPCESKTSPRGDGQPYARDTYGELGSWRVRASLDREIKIIVGAEEGFPGLDVIRQNFSCDFPTSNFPISPTLEIVAERAGLFVR